MSWAQRSAAGAVMIAAIMLLRALTLQRLPKRTFVALWGVALARLMLPWELPSPLSVYAWVGKLLPNAGRSAGTVEAAQTVLAEQTPLVFTAAEQTGAASVPDWRLIVWLSGALLCGAGFALAYRACRRTFRESLPVRHEAAQAWLQGHPLRRRLEIRQSDRVSTPLTYGVLRPVILLPKAFGWEDRDAARYVLTHELVHICRFDGLFKAMLAVAACVHWFNPAVWGMYALANRDLELSCDEAVLRFFGEKARADYAMALLRLEERRSGAARLYSGFGMNAIEERIKTMMKSRKYSAVTAAVAVALVFGVTAAFATSANGDAEKPVTPPETEAIGAMDSAPQVEWWTAEEYAVWLESEKQALQSGIGEQGWTPSTGWFTWTQEMVDETISQYEVTLKEIERGVRVSRAVYDENGETAVQLIQSYDPNMIMQEADKTETDAQAEASWRADDYERFGMTYREAEDALYLNGSRVRSFLDGVVVDGGMAVAFEWQDEQGVVDAHTVRRATQNADGSMDPFGQLIDVELDDPQIADNRNGTAMAQAQEEVTVAFDEASAPAGTTLAERFARYAPFGITFEEDQAGGLGNVYWNGQLVNSFTDQSPTGGVFSFTSSRPGGLRLRTVYADDRLTGVESI